MKSKHRINQEYCKAFGAHLRELRETKGYKMREFALLADMEYGALSKYELGTTNITISTALHLAETLGVSHTELYNFKFPKANK